MKVVDKDGKEMRPFYKHFVRTKNELEKSFYLNLKEHYDYNPQIMSFCFYVQVSFEYFHTKSRRWRKRQKLVMGRVIDEKKVDEEKIKIKDRFVWHLMFYFDEHYIAFLGNYGEKII